LSERPKRGANRSFRKSHREFLKHADVSHHLAALDELYGDSDAFARSLARADEVRRAIDECPAAGQPSAVFSHTGGFRISGSCSLAKTSAASCDSLVNEIGR